ncbi:alcohol dehydrogenase catalytic domain-containing protein [Nocardia sp. IFM 10818]
MRAVTIQDGNFVVSDVQDPRPAAGAALIRVHAAGLNAADLLQARGGYPAPPGWPQDIPGLEFAGVIERLGPGTSGWSIGDRVMALVGGGAHAQRLTVPADALLPIPDIIDDVAAAGFAEAFSTAWDGLVDQAGVRAGERVLITGAAGGVGTAMVQVAALAGADVVASVRNRGLHERVRGLGADIRVVTPEQERAHGPYDVVVELVGGPDCLDRVAWLNTHGRVLVIGVGAGSHTSIHLFDLMVRRARVLGSTIRARSDAEKAALAQRVRSELLGHLAGGRVRVPVDSVHTLDEAPRAYERLGAAGKFGKVVLRFS